jgi:hypothetical protein
LPSTDVTTGRKATQVMWCQVGDSKTGSLKRATPGLREPVLESPEYCSAHALAKLDGDHRAIERPAKKAQKVKRSRAEQHSRLAF